MAEPDNIVLRELRAMRKDNDFLRENVVRLTELVGRVVSDLAALRADVARVQSDMVLLENQNISRHGEIINILRRLEPLEDDLHTVLEVWHANMSDIEAELATERGMKAFKELRERMAARRGEVPPTEYPPK